MMKQKNKIINCRKGILISFFFPLYPYSIFKNVQLVSLLAILISIRMIMQYTNIYIPAFGISLSFAWTPLIIIGWIFGPIYGIFIGFITDTITFLIKPSIWFWLHAIQEPMVGFLSGLFGSIYLLLKRKGNKNLKIINIVINQAILFIFSIISILIIIFWVNENTKFEGKTQFEKVIFDNLKYFILSFFILFITFIEIYLFTSLKNKSNIEFIVWAINLSIVLSTIFSFLLGPISTIEYFKYINGKYSDNFIKYGITFYLIPRIVKESIKVPIQILIFMSILPFINFKICLLKENLRLKWK